MSAVLKYFRAASSTALAVTVEGTGFVLPASVGNGFSQRCTSSLGDVLFRGPIEPKHADEATEGLLWVNNLSLHHGLGICVSIVGYGRCHACLHPRSHRYVSVSAQPAVAHVDQQPAVPNKWDLALLPCLHDCTCPFWHLRFLAVV